MKQLLLIAAIATLASFYLPLETLSKKERKFATSYLKTTKNDVAKSIKGLSEEQLNFKSSPDRWSVKECVYHIALSENNLRYWVDSILNAPANPEKKQDIKMTDEQVMKGISDRSRKVKTFEPFEPRNAKWSNANEALDAFRESREKLIDYIKTTSDDMRSHISVQTPLGPLDSYQLVLFISSHTNRHIQQIEEVKADPAFPKN